MANTLIRLANHPKHLSEHFYTDTVHAGFSLIGICKALLVDFVDTIVYFYCQHRARGKNINAITNMLTFDTGLNDYLVHNYVCKIYT